MPVSEKNTGPPPQLIALHEELVKRADDAATYAEATMQQTGFTKLEILPEPTLVLSSAIMRTLRLPEEPTEPMGDLTQYVQILQDDVLDEENGPPVHRLHVVWSKNGLVTPDMNLTDLMQYGVGGVMAQDLVDLLQKALHHETTRQSRPLRIIRTKPELVVYPPGMLSREGVHIRMRCAFCLVPVNREVPDTDG